MAIGIVLKFAGDGTELLKKYDEINHLMDVTQHPPDGLIYHWAAKTSTGLQVTDVWQTRAQFDRFLQEKILPNSLKVGLPQPQMEFLEVYNTITGRTLVTH